MLISKIDKPFNSQHSYLENRFTNHFKSILILEKKTYFICLPKNYQYNVRKWNIFEIKKDTSVGPRPTV